MSKGWYNNSMKHSLASRGIKDTNLNQFQKTDPDMINQLLRRFRKRIKNKNELTGKYTLEFIRALRDVLGDGECYKISNFNILLYKEMYIDGTGTYSKEQIEKKYGDKIMPYGWSHNYNENKLNEYKIALSDSLEEYESDSR